MFSQVGLGTDHIARATTFYDATLGIPRRCSGHPFALHDRRPRPAVQ